MAHLSGGADIGAHGAIGNLRTIALVSTAGTIDYLCHPQLDSPSVFCALLDPEKGGAFAIAPRGNETWNTRQIYIPDTNVLMTRFMDGRAVFEITDYMPITIDDGPQNAVLRYITCVHGKVELSIHCAPRFDYGRDGDPKLSLDRDAAIFSPNGNSVPGPLRLRGTVSLEDAGHGAVSAAVSLKQGETASFILECGTELPTGDEAPAEFMRKAFAETIAYWQSWSAHSTYKGRWREHVMRSALVLKLLSSAEHGSIAAAATFGLPEQPGGGRNWDYRFCWIRDAAFATFALMRLGYVGEAGRFNDWVADRADCSEAGDLQILYRLDGEREAEEEVLSHLAGYGGAQPVRIGNAAASQLQLDIYGALFDSAYLADKHGAHVTFATWERMARTLNWVCRNWDQPDEGIWKSAASPSTFCPRD